MVNLKISSIFVTFYRKNKIMGNIDLIVWKDILIKMSIGIIVVFITLAILVLLFKGFSNFIEYFQKKYSSGKIINTTTINNDLHGVPTDVSAVIGLAISMYFSDYHDDESNIITIKRITENYSPWILKN